ncbi:MAG: NAD(+)/NADH kinase [Pseudomonadota bacterium]
MKQIGILARKKQAVELAERLKVWLRAKGVEPIEAKDDLPASVGAVVVLGGDGTMLHAVKLVGAKNIPVLGINLGELGFLTEVSVAEMYDAMEMVLAGNYQLERRMMLSACLFKDGAQECERLVLNDVVFNRGAVARLVHLRTTIDGRYLTTYRADGLIVTTPTGSTAYSLSAGGPIVDPTHDTILLTPICPHTLTNRPIVLPDTCVVRVEMGGSGIRNVSLTFDGQPGYELDAGDVVEVQKARMYFSLIRLPGKDYFDNLRTRLKWGG